MQIDVFSYWVLYPVSELDPCGSSALLDTFSASGSTREDEGEDGSAEGEEGGRAVAFQPLRNDTIAAARPKSEIQVSFLNKPFSSDQWIVMGR